MRNSEGICTDVSEQLVIYRCATICSISPTALAKYILADVKNRSQIAFQWLYEEFNICLENSRGLNDRAAQENYDACLMSLLQGLLDKHDAKER